MAYAVDQTGIVHFAATRTEAVAKARQADQESK